MVLAMMNWGPPRHHSHLAHGRLRLVRARVWSRARQRPRWFVRTVAGRPCRRPPALQVLSLGRSFCGRMRLDRGTPSLSDAVLPAGSVAVSYEMTGGVHVFAVALEIVLMEWSAIRVPPITLRLSTTRNAGVTEAV